MAFIGLFLWTILLWFCIHWAGFVQGPGFSNWHALLILIIFIIGNYFIGLFFAK